MSTGQEADERFAPVTLRAARRRADMSQRALAQAAGVAPSVLSAYETGARQPSAKMLARLIRATGAELAVVEPGHERLRQKAQLELAVGTASALPRRPPGPLVMPPFRELTRRR
ncbi:MAG: helix-turn-helix transcriptional regulator [Mycobacteriales bacterium]